LIGDDYMTTCPCPLFQKWPEKVPLCDKSLKKGRQAAVYVKDVKVGV